MISGTQEDFDLVVAFDFTIILVEAKFASGWNSEQLRSKIARLHSLAGMAVPTDFFGEGGKAVKIYFALMSPDKSEAKDVFQLVEPVRNSTPYILTLKAVPRSPNFLMVERCNDRGASDRDGERWHLREWANPS